MSLTFISFKFAERDHHSIHHFFRVITLGWISLIFLTQRNVIKVIFGLGFTCWLGEEPSIPTIGLGVAFDTIKVDWK